MVVSAPVKDPSPVLNIVYGINHVSWGRCRPPFRDTLTGLLACLLSAGAAGQAVPALAHGMAGAMQAGDGLCTAFGPPQELYDAANDHIVTAASCTTNCLVRRLCGEHVQCLRSHPAAGL